MVVGEKREGVHCTLVVPLYNPTVLHNPSPPPPPPPPPPPHCIHTVASLYPQERGALRRKRRRRRRRRRRKRRRRKIRKNRRKMRKNASINVTILQNVVL